MEDNGFIARNFPTFKKLGAANLLSFFVVALLAVGVIFTVQQFQEQKQTRSSAQMTPGESIDNCKINNVAVTSQMAFCDLFILPAQAGNRGRGGDLDVSRWSFARLTSDVNPSQGSLNDFSPANLQFCRVQKAGLAPDNDSFFCGLEFNEPNHWMEGFRDGGAYAMDSAKITQPFDFANRTGVISFDVDAHTVGEHDIWPEVWITDEPVQAPHTDHPGTHEFPKNGVGFILNNECGAPGLKNSLRHISVFRNYVQTDISGGTNCITTEADKANHFEIKISQNKIEFWGSDKGGTNFRKLETFDNLNLPFTRGYVHFQHSQYNAGKFGPTDTGTFHWHALGFDGPVLPADRTYQVPDSLTKNGDSVNTGYLTPFSYTFNNVDLSHVKQAYLTLNTYYFDNAKALTYTVNGIQHSYASAQSTGYQWNYIVIPLVLSELKQGANTITLNTSGACTFACTVVANIDLDLVLNDNAPFAKFVNPPVPCVTPYSGYTAAPCGYQAPMPPSTITPIPTSLVSSSPTPTMAQHTTPTPTTQPTQPPLTGSASMSIQPATQSVPASSAFTVMVHENSGTTPVNATQAVVTYPTALLRFDGFDTTTMQSAFPVMAQQTESGGTITIARGTTTPVSGNQHIVGLKFSVRAPAAANAAITLTSSSVLLSSQTNTNILSQRNNATVNITVTKTGDLNNDSKIDILDLSIFLNKWNSTDSTSDMNHDGTVNILDLSILLSQWGK